MYKRIRKITLMSALVFSAISFGGCTAGQIPGWNGDPSAIVSPNEMFWNGSNLLQSIERFGETAGQLGQGW